MKSLLLAFIIGFFSMPVEAQNFDYQPRPKIDYRFTKADIILSINPATNTLSGVVKYNLKANIDGADSLFLDAAGIKTDSVLSKGKNISFTTENNHLRVALTDSSEAGKTYQLKIYYRATPPFGLLKSSDNSMWTSMLPRTNRHWIPVMDNPHTQLTATLSLVIPASYKPFASGLKTDEQLLPDSTQKVTFRTGRAIPLTDLVFGFGHFREKHRSLGIKRINSYAEANSISAAEQSQLVDMAKQEVHKIAGLTGTKYPYQRLQLVILNDHHWEEKTYGASTIFLYKNMGNYRNQLLRGLYGQWFGVYKHAATWKGAWPVHTLQAALHRKLSDSVATLKANLDDPQTKFSTVYKNFSAERWNAWQRYAANHSTKQIAAVLIPYFLKQGPGIITPESFEEAWYQNSGQPSMEMPDFESNSSQSLQNDTIRYRLNYKLNQTHNKLTVVFTAQKGVVQQPLRVPVQIIQQSKVDHANIRFSGSKDSAIVSIPAGAENVLLQSPNKKIIFEEHKPVPYLLYQLSNGKTTEVRKKAATQLGYHTNDPDLQLALNDEMGKDMAPQVKAALLRSYGKITKGAEGTQDRFLKALKSNNEQIRAAALDVLNNYKQKEITRKLRSFEKNERDSTLSNKALRMYMQRIDSNEAFNFTNQLVQQDTVGSRAIIAVAKLAAIGETGKAVKYAKFYIKPVYAYPVRKQAFQILLAHDDSAKGWKKRATNLLQDYDPRIRFLTAKNINKIPGVDANELLQSRLKKEYDARVYEQLKQAK